MLRGSKIFTLHQILTRIFSPSTNRRRYSTKFQTVRTRLGRLSATHFIFDFILISFLFLFSSLFSSFILSIFANYGETIWSTGTRTWHIIKLMQSILHTNVKVTLLMFTQHTMTISLRVYTKLQKHPHNTFIMRMIQYNYNTHNSAN